MRVGTLAAGAIGGTVLLLALIGAPLSRPAAPPPAPVPPPAASVAAGEVTLTSAAIALPDEAEAFPAGPHADLVTARCTACHSAAMVLTQPPLSPEQWQATVTKMREVYRAPVPDADLPAILAYLNGLSAAKSKEPS